MTTIKTRAAIDEKGNLHLDVPVGLPSGNAEVFLVIERSDSLRSEASGRSGLFADVGHPDVDVDATLNDMNQAWKSKLSGVQ